MRKILLFALMTGVFLAPAAGSATAAKSGYPVKPVNLICPFAAGSTTDLASRSLANSAKKFFPQPIVVVNRPGASGVVAASSVAVAPPDGYTLLMSRVSCNGSVPALNKTIPYKIDDFTFIAVTEITPFVICVLADSPYKTLKDLMEAIKARPGELSFGTSGALSMLDIVGMMMLDAAGLAKTAAVSVPYKGDGEAKTALLGGHIRFLPNNLSPMMDVIKSGQVRALAVTTEKRLEMLPDVPTIAEAGMPGLTNAVGWSGVFGPKGMKREDIAVLVELMQKLENDPEWQQTTKNLGAIPNVLSPAETEKFVMEQYNKFSVLGEKLQITIK
jgi:tripartite-type tricarboxylate transporter receptor subunit TctC